MIYIEHIFLFEYLQTNIIDFVNEENEEMRKMGKHFYDSIAMFRR